MLKGRGAMKIFTKIAATFILFALAFSVAACGAGGDSVDQSGESGSFSTIGASADGAGGGEKTYAAYKFNATMYAGLDKTKRSRREFFYDGRVFDCKNTEFSVKLAEFLMQSTVANKDLATVKEYFVNAKFDDVEYIDYEKPTTKNSVAYVVAHKKEGDTDIIQTSIRGLAYDYEWTGNFDCGAEGDYHSGFYQAAQKVYDGLVGYIEKYAYNPVNCKFFITGYSRAGAIAEIVGCKINSEYNRLLPREKVYIYTFETPPCVVNGPVYTANIFNVISREDLVVNLFPASFGFKRVGREIDVYREDYADLLKEHFGFESVAYYGGVFYNSGQLLGLAAMALLGQEVDKEEYVSLHTRADYCENGVQALSDTFMFVYLMPAAKRTVFVEGLQEALGDDYLSAIISEGVLYDAVEKSAIKAGVDIGTDGKIRRACEKLRLIAYSAYSNSRITAASVALDIANNVDYIFTMHTPETVYSMLLHYGENDRTSEN